MNKNIDLRQILKDCPRGTKLYSKVHGEVEFAYIVEKSNKPIVVIATQKDNNETYYKDFTANGCLYSAYEVDECLLVPSKEQQDWSKFSAPWYKQDDERLRKTTIAFLKDLAEQGYENAVECIDWLEKQDKKSTDEPRFNIGDWVVNKFGDSWHIDSFDKKNYQVYNGKGNYSYFPISKQDEMHFWTIQDAKDGDVIHFGTVTAIFKKYIGREECICYCSFCKDGDFEIPIENGEDNVYGCYNATPATKEQRDLLFQKIKEAGYKWNAETNIFEELVEPKFKVGDKIVNSSRKYMRDSSSQGIISKITDDKYIFTDGSYIFISEQDRWELVQDRFDPKTLKPFDRVLVRDCNNSIWGCSMFSHIVEDVFSYACFETRWNRCIPYNDETKHLVGTTNEAPEYYRYWEN